MICTASMDRRNKNNQQLILPTIWVCDLIIVLRQTWKNWSCPLGCSCIYFPIWGTGCINTKVATESMTCIECQDAACILTFLLVSITGLRMLIQSLNRTEQYLLLTDWIYMVDEWNQLLYWLARMKVCRLFQSTQPITNTWHPPSSSAFLLRWEHGECYSSLLCQPGFVLAGPGAGGVAEGRPAPGLVSSAGRPARLTHRWWLPGRPVPLRPRAGHGTVQSAAPTHQVGCLCWEDWFTHTHTITHRWLMCLIKVSPAGLSVIQWNLCSEGHWSPPQRSGCSGKLLLQHWPGIQVSALSSDMKYQYLWALGCWFILSDEPLNLFIQYCDTPSLLLLYWNSFELCAYI